VHPCTGTEALYRPYGSRGIALPFLDHGTRRGWGVSVTLWLLFTPGKDTVPIVQDAGWAPEPVWTGAENLDSTGFRSPDRPARSQSLYRLSYPARNSAMNVSKFWLLKKGILNFFAYHQATVRLPPVVGLPPFDEHRRSWSSDESERSYACDCA